MRVLLILCLSIVHLGNVQWIAQVSGTNEHLNTIYFVNESIGYCVGNNGTVLKTSNGGDLWTSLEIESSADFSFLYFTDENKGWVVAPQGEAIYQTDNGGDSFSLFDSSLFGNTDSDKQLTWAIILGAKGNIVAFQSYFSSISQPESGTFHHIITFDGGNTWENFYPSVDYNLKMEIINESTFYLAATNAAIQKSVDSGTNWEVLGYLNFSINCVTCYKVFDDEGSSWVSLSYHGESITFNFEDDSVQTLVGEPTFLGPASFPVTNIGYFLNGSKLYKSEDQGITFSLLTDELSGIKNLYFVDENIGFVCGNNGAIYKTTTGGLSISQTIRKEIKIYPNPAHEKINIEYDNSITIQEIQLFDLSGKIIKTYSDGFEALDIQNLAKGNYILKIFSNKKVQAEIIVIK